MSLAIFDLDNTLIAGDSDHAWGEFLLEQNLVDAEQFKQKNDQFYHDYCAGQLDINAYLHFALAPLAKFSTAQLKELHQQFMQEKIAPIKLSKAETLIEKHKQRGDTLLVITATNRFITEPIVHDYGIEHLLACDAEIIDGRYTGRPIGTPCFQEGKIVRLEQWLTEHNTRTTHTDRYFYSDSHNDIPLLSEVEHPIAVDPDETLYTHAKLNDWEIISLR